MAGKDKAGRAASAADEAVARIAAMNDHMGALQVLERLRAALEDRQRALEKEVRRMDDRREERLTKMAGEAALRLLFRGTEEQRAWLRTRLAPALDQTDGGDGSCGVAWLEERFASREAAEADAGAARAARRERAARAFGCASAGAPGADTAVATVPGDAAPPRSAVGVPTADPAGGLFGMADGGRMVRVVAISFAQPPAGVVRAKLRTAGLVWAASECKWRPKAPGSAVDVTAATASEFRAAGGAILEA